MDQDGIDPAAGGKVVHDDAVLTGANPDDDDGTGYTDEAARARC